MTFAACVFALLGFALLALSQERHFGRVFEFSRPTGFNQRTQKATGFIAVSLNLPLCMASHGGGFGCLLWVMLTCATALAIALTLTWRPRWLRGLRPLLLSPIFNSPA